MTANPLLNSWSKNSQIDIQEEYSNSEVTSKIVSSERKKVMCINDKATHETKLEMSNRRDIVQHKLEIYGIPNKITFN